MHKRIWAYPGVPQACFTPKLNYNNNTLQQ